MSLCRAALLASNLAIANVNAIQLGHFADPKDSNIPTNAMADVEFVDWNLENDVTTNNLGGAGPNENDPEEMRIPGVKTVNGEVLDLVVNAIEDAEPYSANNVGNNRVRQKFGVTNVKAGGTAKLRFRFTKAGEDKTWVHENTHKLSFQFTIFDVDESAKVQEKVIFDTPVDHLYLADGHEWKEGVGKNGGDNTEENPLWFQSTSHGDGGDNPRDGPKKLNPEQERRAITVAYQDKTEWIITFQAPLREGQWSNGGRNFLWAGGSHVPDAQACVEWVEPTFPWAICDKKNDSHVRTNNLGGLGPNKEDPEEIRYGLVANVHGHVLDLVVKADDGYDAWNVSRNTVINGHSGASIHGCFGAINVKHETTATLRFTFVHTGTDDPAKIGEDDGFGFTVYDLDKNDDANEERVRFLTKPHGWIFPGNEVTKITGEDGTYKSLSKGDGKDNVLSKDDARDWDQIRKSVRVMYQGIASWKVQFDVRGGTEGRNFLFGGCLHLPEDVVIYEHAYKHLHVNHADAGDMRIGK